MNANCEGDLADLEKIVASVGREGDTVLVTGGNGFLGQHVISQLHQRAHHIKEIRVLDLWPYVKKLGMSSLVINHTEKKFAILYCMHKFID